ncbi:unnamed protein product [Musa banksii]
MQDEYLTSVSGYVKHDCSEFPCVSQLTFTTNLAKTYGPYGGGGGTFFQVNVEYDEIKGFFGHATEEYLTAFEWIVSTLQEGLLSQHHVDSKYSEMLGSCISKEAFDVVIFYVYFEKGSTPTSIWTITSIDVGEACLNSSPSEPPYLGVTPVVPSISKVILTEFTHEAAPTLMPVILSAGSMPQRDSLSHGHLRMPHPRACATVLISYNYGDVISYKLIVNTLHKGWLSQHHVDSKCSEILCSCLSKEALNLVIFYVDFKRFHPHLHMDRMSFQDWW